MTPRPPSSTLFPTRRSSDLVTLEGGDEPDASLLALRHDEQPRGAAVKPVDDAWAVRIAVGEIHVHGEQRIHERRRARRSEEHTSELQSRLHLVCRLLLEKKN